jgi:hypothetical protein
MTMLSLIQRLQITCQMMTPANSGKSISIRHGTQIATLVIRSTMTRIPVWPDAIEFGKLGTNSIVMPSNRGECVSNGSLIVFKPCRGAVIWWHTPPPLTHVPTC